MAKVTVKGPEAVPSLPAVQSPQSVAAQAQNQAPVEKSAWISTPAILLFALGGAGLITGAILVAIAANRASYLRSRDDGTLWTADIANKNSSERCASKVK